jgi:hypothetical protein
LRKISIFAIGNESGNLIHGEIGERHVYYFILHATIHLLILWNWLAKLNNKTVGFGCCFFLLMCRYCQCLSMNKLKKNTDVQRRWHYSSQNILTCRSLILRYFRSGAESRLNVKTKRRSFCGEMWILMFWISLLEARYCPDTKIAHYLVAQYN